MLYKVEMQCFILKAIYHAIFEPHIYYACIILGWNVHTINFLFKLQKKVLGLIHFK